MFAIEILRRGAHVPFWLRLAFRNEEEILGKMMTLPQNCVKKKSIFCSILCLKKFLLRALGLAQKIVLEVIKHHL